MPFTESRSSSRHSRDWAGLVLLWLIATACDLFKPYHIDDTAYLLVARWIGHHPLHPMSGLLNWSDATEPIASLLHPHLFLYLLAGWTRIFGFSEPATHALQSLVALACIVLFYRLARVFVPDLALWITALLVLGPAFLVEQNLMIDLPLLATWLVFFGVLIGGVGSEKQNQRFLIAALACGAGALIKYSSLLLLPIMCLALLLERRKRQWWAPLVSLAMIGAWSAFNVFDYGHAHILGVHGSTDRDPHQGLNYAIAWVLTLGALHVLGIIALVQSRPSWRRHEGTIYAAYSAGWVVFFMAVLSGRLSTHVADLAIQAAFLVNAVCACIPLLLEGRKLVQGLDLRRTVAGSSAQGIYLFSWILLTSCFYVALAPFVAARHVLTMLPAVLLLTARNWTGKLTTTSRVYALVMTVVLSAGLCVSDWRFASFYRTEAAELTAQPVVQQTWGEQRTVWTNQHWGWQWYSENDGLRQVDSKTTVLRPGDLLITGEPMKPRSYVPPAIRLKLVQTDVSRKPLLNAFCTADGARFYHSPYHRGPWFFTADCVDQLYFYRVESAAPA